MIPVTVSRDIIRDLHRRAYGTSARDKSQKALQTVTECTVHADDDCFFGLDVVESHFVWDVSVLVDEHFRPCKVRRQVYHVAGAVSEASPVQVGDRIMRINGECIYDFYGQVRASGQTMVLEVVRNDASFPWW